MFDILCKMQKAKYNLWKDVFFSGRKVKAQMHHIFIAAINIDLPQHNSKYFKGPIFQKKKEKKRKRDALVQDLCGFLSQKYSVSGQKFLYIQYSMTKRKPQSVSNIYGLTGEKNFWITILLIKYWLLNGCLYLLTSYLMTINWSFQIRYCMNRYLKKQMKMFQKVAKFFQTSNFDSL